MKCQRCDGLMVVDHYIDMEDDSGHLWLRAWRCVACGNVLDHRIQRHRVRRELMLARLKRAWVGAAEDEESIAQISA